MRAHRAPKRADCECHIGRCNQKALAQNGIEGRIESHLKTWEDSLMNKDVDMGIAGSLTMIVLVSTTALLLRSFYKRYNRLNNNEDKSEN